MNNIDTVMGVSGDTGVSLDYDVILAHVGHFGPFQLRTLLLLSCTAAVGGLAVVVFPFTGYVPNYR